MSGTTPRSALRRACSFNGDYFSQVHVPIADPGNVDRALLDQFSPINSRRRARQQSEATPSRGVPPPNVTEEENEPDPKRNRLGYTRSTIACVHCRRRKIRCIVSTKDPTGRCMHCLRMKKDCSYLPVDQSVPTKKKKNKRQQPLRQAGSSESNIATTSSLNVSSSVPTLFEHGAAAAIGRTLAPAPNFINHGEQASFIPGNTSQAPNIDPSWQYGPPPPISMPDLAHGSVLDQLHTASRHNSLSGPSAHDIFSPPLLHQMYPPSMEHPHDLSFQDTMRQPSVSMEEQALFSTPLVNINYELKHGRSMSTNVLSAPEDPYFAPASMESHLLTRSTTFPLPSITFDDPLNNPLLSYPTPAIGHAMPTISFDDPFFPAASTAYLSPLTGSSGPSTAQPSVSPMPPPGAYLSPPASESASSGGMHATTASSTSRITADSIRSQHINRDAQSNASPPLPPPFGHALAHDMFAGATDILHAEENDRSAQGPLSDDFSDPSAGYDLHANTGVDDLGIFFPPMG